MLFFILGGKNQIPMQDFNVFKATNTLVFSFKAAVLSDLFSFTPDFNNTCGNKGNVKIRIPPGY
jgi:hypothetical protein